MVRPGTFWLYLPMNFGSKFMYHERDEKGIRCKTGAVPAAVNPIRQLTD